MPLRDHFHVVPGKKKRNWSGLHGQWPATIVQQLRTKLPALNETLAIPLDLEASYEQTCHDLWIT